MTDTVSMMTWTEIDLVIIDDDSSCKVKFKNRDPTQTWPWLDRFVNFRSNFSQFSKTVSDSQWHADAIGKAKGSNQRHASLTSCGVVIL